MPIYPITLTDAEVAAITARLDASAASAPPGYVRPYRDAADWLQTQVTTLAQACVGQVAAEDLRKAGVASVQDLTTAERVAIIAARKRPAPGL